MNDDIRVRNDMFIRVNTFGEDNAADFPAASIGAVQFAEIAAVVALIAELSTDQTEGFGDARFAIAGKGSARETLRDVISEISRTSRSMVYEIPDIDTLFRMPRNRNDAELLAAARAFYRESEAYEARFIAYGLPADFRDALNDAADAFESSLGEPGTAIDSHVEATAELEATVRRGMIARRILDGVVKNKYRADVGKLAAWTSASHIERLP